MEFQHKSVLLQECIDALNIRPDGIYLDGTLGGAGHSSQIARRLTEGGRLIGVDRDRTALAAAKERLAPYADRVTLVHSNFAEIDAILDSLGIPAAVRPRRFVAAARRCFARLFLHGGRPARYAHG